MNFVAEILSSADKVEIENVNKQILDVLSTVDGYKQDVLLYIDKVYNKFSERPKSNIALLNKANDMKNNICELENNINNFTNNDITAVKSKVITYQQQLIECKHALEIASTLIRIHEILINMKSCLQNKQYYEGVKNIEEIKQYVDYEELFQTDVYNAIMNKFSITQDILVTQLIEEFKEYVQYNNCKPFILTIRKNESIEEILRAIRLTKIELINELITFLWNNVFSPIVNSNVSVNVTENEEICKIVLNVNNENEKGDYKDVFKNLLTAAKFLDDHFNYPLENTSTTFNYIADIIKDNLSDLIIKNCLAHTIPSNSDELQRYKGVIEDTENLQKDLVRYGIFSADTTSILSFTKNVDVLFINKKCEEYITATTEIMKKDLHDMVEVGTAFSEISSLNDSSNMFPRCFVSKSTLDLIDLTDKIMQNAVACESATGKLYLTVQNIYHTYGTVVQDHHQKLLQTIPQQVALFHNNCMYLSYKLSVWNETFQLPSTICGEPILLMEKAHLLKQIGIKVFVECLEQQIKQIEDIMKESGIFSISTLEKLEPITEKSIRQCLRQQELLRTVWHKVLSHSDYNRSIGCILNFLCNSIINELLKIEDISSEAGDQLVDIFKVILTRGPKLFIDPIDIHIYVKSWYKFNEIVFVLSSSLIEICDRWADGKGPLALQFKPEEVQKLIRALFQNTERRAAVLAKIAK